MKIKVKQLRGAIRNALKEAHRVYREPASSISSKKVSETGAYYGKTAAANGAIMGGNGQKDPDMTCACGDPGCTGCEES